MGFQQPNNVASFNRPAGNNNAGGRPNWQADAYLNIYLPKRNGNRTKLGALKLSLNRRNDSQVIEHLQNAPDLEEALNRLKDLLEFDFQMVGQEVPEDEALDLG